MNEHQAEPQHISPTEEHIRREIEGMLERVLNAKGRVKIKTQQPWWWNIFTFLLGCAVTTIGWAWSGKAALDEHMHKSLRNYDEQQVVNKNLSNHVNVTVAGLGFRVNRIAAQGWTANQEYAWGEQFRRMNQTGTNRPFEIPDIDRIRAQFPLQLE